METRARKARLCLVTYQARPAALLVSPALQAEPTAPHQPATPWVSHHLKNMLQNHRKFWVWSEVYEQFGVLLFLRGKTRVLLTGSFKKAQTSTQRDPLRRRGDPETRGVTSQPTGGLGAHVSYSPAPPAAVRGAAARPSLESFPGPPRPAGSAPVQTSAPEDSHAH